MGNPKNRGRARLRGRQIGCSWGWRAVGECFRWLRQAQIVHTRGCEGSQRERLSSSGRFQKQVPAQNRACCTTDVLSRWSWKKLAAYNISWLFDQFTAAFPFGSSKVDRATGSVEVEFVKPQDDFCIGHPGMRCSSAMQTWCEDRKCIHSRGVKGVNCMSSLPTQPCGVLPQWQVEFLPLPHSKMVQ